MATISKCWNIDTNSYFMESLTPPKLSLRHNRWSLVFLTTGLIFEINIEPSNKFSMKACIKVSVKMSYVINLWRHLHSVKGKFPVFFTLGSNLKLVTETSNQLHIYGLEHHFSDSFLMIVHQSYNLLQSTSQNETNSCQIDVVSSWYS